MSNEQWEEGRSQVPAAHFIGYSFRKGAEGRENKKVTFIC